MKWTIVSISFVVAPLLIAIFSLQGKTFEAPFPDNIVAVKDSAVIARGQYLAYGPAHCGNCHSPMSNQSRINAGEILPLSGGFELRLPLALFMAPTFPPTMKRVLESTAMLTLPGPCAMV